MQVFLITWRWFCYGRVEKNEISWPRHHYWCCTQWKYVIPGFIKFYNSGRAWNKSECYVGPVNSRCCQIRLCSLMWWTGKSSQVILFKRKHQFKDQSKYNSFKYNSFYCVVVCIIKLFSLIIRVLIMQIGGCVHY